MKAKRAFFKIFDNAFYANRTALRIVFSDFAVEKIAFTVNNAYRISSSKRNTLTQCFDSSSLRVIFWPSIWGT